MRRTRPHGRASGRRPISRASTRSCSSWGASPKASGALVAHLSDVLVISYHSDDFDEASKHARRSPPSAHCAVLRRTAGDAQDHLAGIDTELSGLLDPVES